MGLGEHEKAVRAAVEKTMAQSKIGAVQFRVDRALRELDRTKALLAKQRAEFDAATVALEAAKVECGQLKMAAKAAPISVPEPEDDLLAPIESLGGK